MIDMFVMTSVIGSPKQGRIFESSRSENEGQKSDGPMGLECSVGVKSVIPEGDAQARANKHDNEQADLKKIEAESPEVKRNGHNCQQEGAHQKKADPPVHAVKWDAGHER